MKQEDVDTSKFLTNIFYLRSSGLLYDGTWKSLLLSLFVFGMLISGIFHYGVQVVTKYGELEMILIMQAVHWFIVYTMTTVASFNLLRGNFSYLEICSIIKDGFYTYKEPLSKEQLQKLKGGNDHVVRMTKIYVTVIFSALVMSISKEPFFGNDPNGYNLAYPGWIPFEINSNFRYAVAICYQIVMASNMTFNAAVFVVIFVALSGHLMAQLEIIQIAVTESFIISGKKINSNFDETSSSTLDRNNSKYQQILYDRIKEIVAHHNIIIRYFDLFQEVYSYILLSIAIGTALMFCTLGYLLTDPNSTFVDIAAFASVFVPEFFISCFYCWCGQKIMDESDKLRHVIFYCDWYIQSTKVQKLLLLVLIKSEKTLTLSGAGLQTFSMAGLSDILQASYTYFNMLIALR